MGIMAVGALHLFLRDRVMGRILHPGLDIHVTGVAAFRFWLGQQFLPAREMNLVARSAAYVIQVVFTAGPIVPRVAIQTNSALLCWCEFVTTDDILTILRLNMQASIAMACLTPSRETGSFKRSESSVNALLEIIQKRLASIHVTIITRLIPHPCCPLYGGKGHLRGGNGLSGALRSGKDQQYNQ